MSDTPAVLKASIPDPRVPSARPAVLTQPEPTPDSTRDTFGFSTPPPISGSLLRVPALTGLRIGPPTNVESPEYKRRIEEITGA